MINKRLLNFDFWEVIVPKGIRFLSDWKEFDFAEFPQRCIINKQIPGCGYTEWCIRNSYNVILCSPRKMLLENKYDQHPGEVFLVVNELDRDPNVDKDINKVTRGSAARTEQELAIEQLGFSTPDTYNRIRSQLLEYISQRSNQPLKILVTYDSYYIIKDILEGLKLFNTFFTVVDEYQSILSDSRFKSNTELEFMSVIKTVQYVHFVSATPMLDKYSKMLEDFKDLPMFKLNWSEEDSSRVVKPNLKVLIMKSIGEVLPGIIQTYLDGKFDSITIQKEDGSLKDVVSNEAVFYLNSVNHIINIIKRCGLKPEQTNILCSKTPENEKRIKTKLGRKWGIGSVPTRGQQHKMFTFCTRTVYLGADFYSLCAKSYIFSDSNSDCLAVDISQDLPQILGRQRLKENPWRNSAIFYYRSTADYRKMGKEDFDRIIQKKIEETEKLLRGYQNSLGEPEVAISIAQKYRKDTKNSSYKDDYVAVNVKTAIMTPVFNSYVHVSDIRAYDIQQIDYADRFSVFKELETKIVEDTSGTISNLMKEYLELKEDISKRVKFLCDLPEEFVQFFLNNLTNSDYAKSYYIQLGPDRCRALGYRIDKIRKELGIIKFDKNLLQKEVFTKFNIGDKITRSNIKSILQSIYDQINYQKTAKASDIDNWFEVNSITINNSDGTRSNGFKLIKKKGGDV